ncbi:MFS transporter [Rhizomonospora bruguierae]|uniref:MFS transporter n=1 Tax=Rhizomonospora bruguierae TaxID=1581705 RepID=UPI001BCF7948|nr:MFS transporter [Micromonospora sp. NBRC 107566]
MPLLPEPGPTRVLSLATLVNTVGRGVYLAANALFLTRSVGLSVNEVGLALTLAALVGVILSTPAGHLADRYGANRLQLLALVWSALATVALLAVRTFPAALLVAALAAVGDATVRAARGAVIAAAVPAGQRVRTRAYLRATTNVGISLGAVLAGVGLTLDTRPAYVAMILVDAASFLAAAAILTRLPALPPAPTAPGQRRGLIVLRDRPFLTFAVLDGLFMIHHSLLTIGLPLWIAEQTRAPRWMVSVLLLLNTVMVVLFQVRASRGTESLAGAARAARRAGLVIALACGLFGLSAGVPAAVAVPLLLIGALVHVVGELWQSAAGWGISFGLAPAHAQGQYQGAYGMGAQLGGMVAPVVVTSLALGWGLPGWLVLGAAFLLIGALVPAVVRWGERTRAPEGELVTIS